MYYICLIAKYNIVELYLKGKEILNIDNLEDNAKDSLIMGNAIYIYRGSKSKKVYIGQTKQFLSRHKQHFNGSEEKFNSAEFDRVLVIFSQYFNRSALDDVESQLITYFLADSKMNPGQVNYDSDEIINQNCGNIVNKYKEMEEVSSQVILPLWENELYSRGWVSSSTIEHLRTSALVKYSPIKTLTSEQSELIMEIINNPNKSYVINGDAGTGKTVLLTNIVARLLTGNKYSIAVVVQPNWEETANNIFQIYGFNNKNLVIGTSTKIIKSNKRFDVIIVDESHKLSRKYGKQHPAFSEVYKIKEFENCSSHLEILQRMGKQVILMYDVLQGIRPANITRDMFENLTKGYELRFLKTQFRIQTKSQSYTSDDYINGIKYLLYKDTGLLQSKFTNFNNNFNKNVFSDKSKDAYFGWCERQPLHTLMEWIEEDRNYNPEHINRILSGLVEPWKQSDGDDKSITHFHEGDLRLRWNSTQENWVNSKEEDANNQIGSVFAVQGIDLNKVGVLIGPDIIVDSTGKLKADPNSFYNTNGIFKKDEMKDEKNKFEFTLFVLNNYYVLLTRGIDGVRIGFWNNNSFCDYMKKTFEIV